MPHDPRPGHGIALGHELRHPDRRVLRVLHRERALSYQVAGGAAAPHVDGGPMRHGHPSRPGQQGAPMGSGAATRAAGKG